MSAPHKSLQRCVMNKFLEVHQKRPGSTTSIRNLDPKSRIHICICGIAHHRSLVYQQNRWQQSAARVAAALHRSAAPCWYHHCPWGRQRAAGRRSAVCTLSRPLLGRETTRPSPALRATHWATGPRLSHSGKTVFCTLELGFSHLFFICTIAIVREPTNL